MGKKFKLFLISIIVIGVVIAKIPHTYAASSATLSYGGNGTATTGQEFTVDILVSGITGSNLMGAQGNVTSSDPNCVSFVKLTKVSPTNVNNNIFAYADSEGESSNFTVAKATFQAGTSACTTTINITGPKISFTDGTKLTLNTISKTITVSEPVAKSSDATLKSLTIDNGTLSPSFSPNTTTYNVEVESTVTRVTLTPVKNDSKASLLSSSGSKITTNTVGCNISSNSTACSVKVLAEDGTTSKTYTVNITRKAAPVTPSTKDNDATLKSLTVQGYHLTPSFASGTDNYTIKVPNDVTSVDVSALANSSKATVSISGGSNLSIGTNVVKVTVKAEDGTTKDYTINVIREEPKKDNDATLKSLEVEGQTLSPSFSADETSYTLTVPNGVTSLNVNAIPNSSTSSVIVTGESELKVGVNPVRVSVKAEDGTTKVYIINVTREDKEPDPEAPKKETSTKPKSSDNFIKEIITTNGDLSPAFSKAINSYSITVPNEVTKLDLKAVLNDSKAKVNIIGNENFQVGLNVVTIEVTAEDGSLRIYTINVTRSELIGQTKLSDLSVIGQTLSPAFNPDVYEYNIDVPYNIDKLDINAIPASPNSKVEIVGNDNLKEGNNVILVKVTDENGFVQYYRINVNKSPEENKTDKKGFLGLGLWQWLGILGLLLLLGLLIFLIILLAKRKKDDKEEPAKSEKTPVIEFKPEINIGSRNGTDDDYVESGGTLNQFAGALPENANKVIEEATVKEVPYDIYDDIVTKDELFDALKEANEKNDNSKLKILYAQEMLNRKKEELKRKENNR